MNLRKLQQKDAELMLSWMHDDSVVHDLGTDFSKKTIDDCKNFIEYAQDETHDLHLAIIDDNDEYMGTTSLKHINREKSYAEFAITVRKEAMGKGYSSYGMSEIIRKGHEELNLKNIYWCVNVKNKRAVRFYDKSGYMPTNNVPQEILDCYEDLTSGGEVLRWYVTSRDIPSLTVYITTYNRANYLKESIESVLAQTYKDFSLVVLDNCSTDNTEEVVKSFNDSRLCYIRHKENVGGIANIDYAFDNCVSEYIVVFHDDDKMKPDMLEEEIKFLKANPDVTCVSSLTTFFYEDGRLNDIKANYEGECKKYSGTMLWDAYFGEGTNTVCPSIMYRQGFMRKNKLHFDIESGPCCDIKCLFDIERLGGTVASLNKSLVLSRQHDNQDSIVNIVPMHAKLYDYLSKHEYYAPLFNEKKAVRNALYNNYSVWLGSLIVQGKGDIKRHIETEKMMRGALKGTFRDRLRFDLCKFGSTVAPKLMCKLYGSYKKGKEE